MELERRAEAIGFAGAERILADGLGPQPVAFPIDGDDLGLVVEQPLGLVALHSGHRLARLAPGPSILGPAAEVPRSLLSSLVAWSGPTVTQADAGRLFWSKALRARPVSGRPIPSHLPYFCSARTQFPFPVLANRTAEMSHGPSPRSCGPICGPPNQ